MLKGKSLPTLIANTIQGSHDSTSTQTEDQQTEENCRRFLCFFSILLAISCYIVNHRLSKGYALMLVKERIHRAATKLPSAVQS
jgi:hypothetical protein